MSFIDELRDIFCEYSALFVIILRVVCGEVYYLVIRGQFITFQEAFVSGNVVPLPA